MPDINKNTNTIDALVKAENNRLIFDYYYTIQDDEIAVRFLESLKSSFLHEYKMMNSLQEDTIQQSENWALFIQTLEQQRKEHTKANDSFVQRVQEKIWGDAQKGSPIVSHVCGLSHFTFDGKVATMLSPLISEPLKKEKIVQNSLLLNQQPESQSFTKNQIRDLFSQPISTQQSISLPHSSPDITLNQTDGGSSGSMTLSQATTYILSEVNKTEKQPDARGNHHENHMHGVVEMSRITQEESPHPDTLKKDASYQSIRQIMGKEGVEEYTIKYNGTPEEQSEANVLFHIAALQSQAMKKVIPRMVASSMLQVANDMEKNAVPNDVLLKKEKLTEESKKSDHTESNQSDSNDSETTEEDDDIEERNQVIQQTNMQNALIEEENQKREQANAEESSVTNITSTYKTVSRWGAIGAGAGIGAGVLGTGGLIGYVVLSHPKTVETTSYLLSNMIGFIIPLFVA